MPVGFNSPARNLFLLGSSGAQVITNFFKTIDQSAGTDGVYLPDEIKYNSVDQKFVLAGSAQDINSKEFGWFEKRDNAGTADFENRIESTQSGVNTTLRAMELDSNDNLIIVGKTNNVPWIAKYSNGGVIDWQSTTSSGDVEYTGVTSDSNGQYYACGNTPTSGEAQAFVEKFDASGNPGWGKSAFMLGRDVVLNRIAANARGEVVAVGYLEDDVYNKGYIVKIDTNTGEVLWDRTLSPDWQGDMLNCSDVYIDSNDQIYVTVNGTFVGYLIKYTAEGNMIWQKTTDDPSSTITFDRVKSDGETEQTVVFGTYDDGTDVGGVLSKYSKDGSLVWRRTLFSSYNNSNTFSNVCLDADPSFYYLLYIDDAVSGLNGTPEAYTFGKVSSSGNGLGDFQYAEGTGETIDYEILNVADKIGRLSDGSVRQDTSDLITYPFNANKLLFDDLATQVSNKKRQMDGPDSFEYSGSPAIRPADFQELNLLGDVYSGSGDWLDQSGKGNNGVVNGATHNAAGYWEFNGAGNEIKTGIFDKYNFGLEDFTLEAWVRTTNNNHNGKIINKGQSGSFPEGSKGWSLRYISGQIGVSISDGSSFTSVYVSPPAVNTWVHIVASIDRTADIVSLYIGGEFQASTSTASVGDISQPSGEITIGSLNRGIYGSISEYFLGDIGEVRIYPRALTAAQVFQNYNATKSKYINEAPDIAPKIGPGIVYGSNLLLNYDFGNRATYDPVENLLSDNFTFGTDTGEYYTDELGVEHKIYSRDANLNEYFGSSATFTPGTYDLVVSMYVDLTDATSFYFRPQLTFGPPATATVVESDVPSLGSKGIMKVRYSNVQPSSNWFFTVRGTGTAKFARPFLQLEPDHTRYVKTYGTAITAPTTVKNLSSSSYTGTINGATFDSLYGGHFLFDNDYIDAGYSIPTNNFTVETWFKKTDTTYWSPVWACEVWNQSSGYLFYFEGNNVLELTTGGNLTGLLQVNTTGNMTDWRHLVLTIDGSNVATIYQNGVSLGSTTITPVGSIQKPLRLGARFSNDGNGSADGRQTQSGGLRAYNRALSATEVSQNFNATRSKYGV